MNINNVTRAVNRAALATPIVLGGLLLSACSTTPALTAEQIAARYPVIDTHIDVPYRLHKAPVDVSVSALDGQFDHPRAVEGGLNAPFMSIYIPADVDEAGEAYGFANDAIDIVEGLTTAHPDKFALATCADDIDAHMKSNLISLPMGMENGGPVEGSMDKLAHFAQRGIRYITLAHSKSNHISDSSYDTNEHWQGLSDFGKTLIGEMNRVGVMVDVSHISDKAFWQVMDLTKTPVLATHSSMRHFTPGFQRNMSDDMVKALGEQGGVIQINYGSSFLHADANGYQSTGMAAVQAYKATNHLEDDDPALKAYFAKYMEENPYPFADLDIVLDHIDRAVELAGVGGVGIGSDYDGVGDSLPDGLKDVASYPNLVRGLQTRGYSEADIAKILGGNTLRVWRAVEAYARSQGSEVTCAAR